MTGLSIRNLTAHYGRKPIISGLDLPSLQAGEVVAVVGPNGAGKSTFLRALAGLTRAEGEVVLDGQTVLGRPLVERSRKITYMPQTLPQGIALSVLETVVAAIRAGGHDSGLLSDREAVELAQATLERIGAAHLGDMRLDRLSGGQRQLAGLAQAVARLPRLLLLDEPTSALDLYYQLRVLDLVRELAAERGMTVMVVLHDLQAAARVSDKVMVLHQGQLAAFGPPRQALTPALLAEVYRVRASVEFDADQALKLTLLDAL